MESLKVRKADKSDVIAITELFYNTIQKININDYSQDEIDDWSSWNKDIDKWSDKIIEQYFIIAQHDKKIVGFGSLAKDGYLDFMFVHKDFQRQGIANALLILL